MSNNVPPTLPAPATGKKSQIQLQSPAKQVVKSPIKGQSPVKSVVRTPVKTSKRTPVKSQSQTQTRDGGGRLARTPPGAKSFYDPENLLLEDADLEIEGEQEKMLADIAGMDGGMGMGIDANGMTTPVKLRRGGIPRTPPQVVRDL